MASQRTAGRFARLNNSPLRNLVGGVIFVLAVMAASTAAYMEAGWDFGDAAYMVVITVFTVGYQEVRPIDTELLRGITIATIIFGCTGIIFVTGALVQAITITQLQQIFGTRRMRKEIDALNGHIIICGYGRIGQMLAEELTAGQAAFVILERDEPRVTEAQSHGYLACQGDATDEEVLKSVGIERARVLATVLPNDAANVFITLSARSLNKKLEIIARGEIPSTKNKLLQAGANSVVQPTHIGAERIGQLILYPRSSALTEGTSRAQNLNFGLRQLGLEIEVMAVAPDSPFAGRSITEVENEASGSIFIVGINRLNGETLTRPDPETRIQAGDGVVVVTRAGRGIPRTAAGAAPS